MRRKRADKKKVAPDPRYNSKLISKLINYVMLRGKKQKAQRIVYDALESLENNVKEDALDAFNQVIENVRPLVEVRSRRVGGSTFQVPFEVSERRGQALALRWIVQGARGKRGKTMSQKLAQELTDAFNKQGSAIKKREDVHRMADANKAFAHYRW